MSVSNGTQLVSIVVIAFNEEVRIVDCLNSISGQSYYNMEIIVVDDGSTDNTVGVIRESFPSDDRIKIIELGSNQGRGAARLTGLEAATGSLIGFVDADIVLSPDWLDTLILALHGRSAVSGVAVPDGDCAVIWRIFRPVARVTPGSEEITGNNVLFQGDIIREIGFDPKSRLGEDFRLASRMRGLGHSLATITSVVVEHREAKSYTKAIRWLYDSGVDAASLLLEFRRVRTPDIAWFIWFLTHLVLIAYILVDPDGFVVYALISIFLTGFIAFSHVFARFDPRPNPRGWLLAGLANIILMSAYLVGRSVGLLCLISHYIRRKMR